MTCAATMVTASHWVGFTLPGMIDEPGSFSGSSNSPKPVRGPEPSSLMSLAILNSDTATVLSAPCANTRASWRGQRLELVLGADEGELGHLGDLGGEGLGEESAGC